MRSRPNSSSRPVMLFPTYHGLHRPWPMTNTRGSEAKLCEALREWPPHRSVFASQSSLRGAEHVGGEFLAVGGAATAQTVRASRISAGQCALDGRTPRRRAERVQGRRADTIGSRSSHPCSSSRRFTPTSCPRKGRRGRASEMSGTPENVGPWPSRARSTAATARRRRPASLPSMDAAGTPWASALSVVVDAPLGERHVAGVEVVLAHEEDRQLVERREVHGLVRSDLPPWRRRRRRPRRRCVRRAASTPAPAPTGERDRRRDKRHGSQDADVGREQVHRSSAALRAPGRLAVESRRTSS